MWNIVWDGETRKYLFVQNIIIILFYVYFEQIFIWTNKYLYYY